MTTTNPSDTEVAGIGHNKPPLAEVLRDQFKADLAEVERLATEANGLKKELETDDDLVPYVVVVKAARSLATAMDAARKKETEVFRKAESETNDFFRPYLERLDRIKKTLEARATTYNNEKADKERRRLADEARLAREEADRKAAEAAEALDAGKEVEAEVIQNESNRASAAAHGATQAATGASDADLARTRTEAGTVTSTGTWTFRLDDVTKIPLAQLRPFLKLEHIEMALKAYAKANQDKKPLNGVTFFKSNKASFR